jgi:hypothetical protein
MGVHGGQRHGTGALHHGLLDSSRLKIACSTCSSLTSSMSST